MDEALGSVQHLGLNNEGTSLDPGAVHILPAQSAVPLGYHRTSSYVAEFKC